MTISRPSAVQNASRLRTGIGVTGIAMIAVGMQAGVLAAPQRVRAEPDRSGGAAHTARTISLTETGRLHSASNGGNTIAEEGRATGTYDGSITVHLTIVSTNLGAATFTFRPKGGTVSGKGSARFVSKGAYGYFGGTLVITRGTGSFVHASRANIGISGKINRETFSMTVRVHGTVRV